MPDLNRMRNKMKYDAQHNWRHKQRCKRITTDKQRKVRRAMQKQSRRINR